MKIENVLDEESRCLAEYKKDQKIEIEDIKHLKEWIDKQADLPKIGDYMIIQFYTSAMYSLQRTKELIDLHFNFKYDSPEFFTGKDYEPPKYRTPFFELTYLFDLPDHSPDGYRLVYCGFKDYDSSKFNFEIGLRMFVKIMYRIILERGSCEGYSFVFDMQGTHVSHLTTVTVSLVRRFLYFTQEAVPLKVKQVNVINANYLISRIMFLVKPFLSKELYEMIVIDSDMDNFFKRIPKELVPTDLGGTLPYTRDELNNLSVEKTRKWEEVVMEQLKMRSTKSKSASDTQNKIASMNGSFKKLDLD